ncbi:MAG: elongation factor P--(R)-beta-lysine ligase [Pseudohongiella sp.]|nr:MAG: elongation factor P--(R)-beta-lysine ligase [Pseudohongiella sp.]
MVDWKPSASLQNLQQRARMLAKIRSFFFERDVLEVETPLLASTTVPDVYIESIAAGLRDGESTSTAYLQTSPEFFMKRLLASGSGSIYQIAKAFRQEETSKRHNIEFTLLEWYRLSYSLDQLMAELELLLQELLGCAAIPRFSYRELFQQHLQIDPHEISLEDLQRLASSQIDLRASNLSKTDYLQLLLSNNIEPELPPFSFIYDYPKEQAALAAIAEDQQGVMVAKRFELFGHGMELANGYFELSDASEQRVRFDKDNVTRLEKGLETHDPDARLIAALQSGLPSCAGVAVGVDRLLMILVDAKDISDVISFDSERV